MKEEHFLGGAIIGAALFASTFEAAPLLGLAFAAASLACGWKAIRQ